MGSREGGVSKTSCASPQMSWSSFIMAVGFPLGSVGSSGKVGSDAALQFRRVKGLRHACLTRDRNGSRLNL